MAEAAKDQDQSMEDILQSIKRIIAEEGDTPPEAPGSDVLELTDMLAEDGSVSSPTPRPDSVSIDEIMAAPLASMTPKAEEPVVAAPSAPATPAPFAPAPVAVAEPASTPQPVAQAEEEGLISGSTLSASIAALNSLRDSMAPAPVAPKPMTESASFRSGLTVEDLVVEALKPMLKEWLDHNLPGMVEALVKKEISKLTQS